jgi:hypothetical protein
MQKATVFIKNGKAHCEIFCNGKFPALSQDISLQFVQAINQIPRWAEKERE